MWKVGISGEFYLHHDVNILPVLQQTEVGIKVKPVVIDVGFSQDHLALPQGLEEDLLPLSTLLCQQLPLKRQQIIQIKNVPNKLTRPAAVCVYTTYCID